MSEKPKKSKSEHPSSRARAIVDLTICGVSLDPDRVTEALGVSPDHSIRRGELYGRRRSKVGYWSLEGRPTSGRPETQMRSILKRIDPIMDRLKRIMAEESDIEHVVLTIGLVPADNTQVYSCSFKPDLIDGFASLGIEVAFVLYLFWGSPGRSRTVVSGGGAD